MKFSDIPHFIIKKFIERSHYLSSEDAKKDIETFQAANPDFIYKDRVDKHYWEDSGEFTWSGIEHDTWFTDSYLIGPRTSITTIEEGIYLELYVKKDEKFEPIRLRTYPKTTDPVRFFATHMQDLNKPSELDETISEEHFDKDDNPYLSYEFEIYDLWNNRVNLNDGDLLYFRKDSVFHTWLKNNASELLKEEHSSEFIIRQYVNVDKPFIYLGDVYNKPKLGINECYFFHYNIHNFVLDAIPEHQRTEKIKDFAYLAFNILYNNIYQTQKDTWSCIDPLECSQDILSFIGTYHGMDFDLYDFDNTRKRWFIKNLTNVLQTKGTYSSLYTIWKYVTHTHNRLNIYERWHDKSISGAVSENDYYDWLHTSFYDEADLETGAGEGWYSKYFNNPYPVYGEVSEYISTYTFQNPFASGNVIFQFYSDDYVVNPENVYVDNDTIWYWTPNITKAVMFNVDYTENKTGIVWEVNHGLGNTSLMVDTFDTNNYKIYPDEIDIVDGNNIKLTFNNLTSGKINIRALDSGFFEENNNSNDFIVNHGLNSENVCVHVYDTDYKRISPLEIEIVNDTSVRILLDDTEETNTFVSIADEFIVIENLEDESDVIDHGMKLSTQYMVESDISTEPVDDTKVLSKETFDSLYNLWEDFRPIHRTSKYKMMVSPITDLSKNNINLYNKELVPYLDTKSNVSLSNFADNDNVYIEYIVDCQNCTINHDLNSKNLLVDIYNENLIWLPRNKIIYKKINDNNRIEISFTENVTGFVIIKKADKVIERKSIDEDIDDGGIIHPYDTFNLVTQFYIDADLVEPENVLLKNGSVIEYFTSEITRVVAQPSDFSISRSGTEWEINHSLDTQSLIIDVYDADDKKVYPDVTKIVDNNNIRLEFNEFVAGRCQILKINDSASDQLSSTNIGSTFTIQHGMGTTRLFIQVYDDNMEKIKPNYIRHISNDTFEVSLEENITTHTFVKGIIPQSTAGTDVITQFYKEGKVIEPKNSHIISSHIIYHGTEGVDRTITYPADYVSSLQTGSTWNINHSLNKNALLIDVYNEDMYKVYPKNIKIVDDNNVEITFDKDVTGFCHIFAVGKIGESLDVNGAFISSNTESEFTINHSYNTEKVFIQVYDTNMNRIKPKNIEILDSNSVKVTLNSEVNTYTFIKGITISDDFGTTIDDYSWAIQSDSETNFYEMTSEFYADDYMKFPYYVKINGDNEILLEDDEINKVSLANRDYQGIFVSEALTEWTVNHGLDALGLIIDVYNEDWKKIQPDSIQIVNSNSFNVIFNEAQKGYIIVTKVGNPSFIIILDKLRDSQLFVSSVEGILENEFYDPSSGLPLVPNDGDTYIASETANGWEKYHVYEFNESEIQWNEILDNDNWLEIININRVRNEENWIYAEYTLPEEIEMNIMEMVIKDGTETVFYTGCSDLYKSNLLEMNVFYRISKAKIER